MCQDLLYGMGCPVPMDLSGKLCVPLENVQSAGPALQIEEVKSPKKQKLEDQDQETKKVVDFSTQYGCGTFGGKKYFGG